MSKANPQKPEIHGAEHNVGGNDDIPDLRRHGPRHNTSGADPISDLQAHASRHLVGGADPLSLAAVWPIGSVFIAVVSTNPGTLLGFGTWSAIAAGRVLVGLDSGDVDFDVVEETGGAKTSTPNAHSGATVSNHAAKNTDVADTGVMARGSTPSTLTLMAHFHNITAYIHSVGQAAAHAAMSIVQPYFVVYMWKRTA